MPRMRDQAVPGAARGTVKRITDSPATATLTGRKKRKTVVSISAVQLDATIVCSREHTGETLLNQPADQIASRSAMPRMAGIQAEGKTRIFGAQKLRCNL